MRGLWAGGGAAVADDFWQLMKLRHSYENWQLNYNERNSIMMNKG